MKTVSCATCSTASWTEVLQWHAHAFLPRTRLLSVILLMKPEETSRAQQTPIIDVLTLKNACGKSGLWELWYDDNESFEFSFYEINGWLYMVLHKRLRERVIVGQVCKRWVNMIHRTVNTFVMCNFQNHHHKIWEANKEFYCWNNSLINREWT